MSLQGYFCKLFFMHSSLSTNIYWTSGKPRTPPTQERDGLFGNVLNMDSKQLIYLMLANSLSARGLHPRSGGCVLFSLTEENSKARIKIHQAI